MAAHAPWRTPAAYDDIGGQPVVEASRQPLYRMKADFFKALGHPARIRVLELLSEREHAVSEMVPEIGIEPANLSQQLSVLRRAGLVVARRDGLSVTYALTSPRIAELLATARAILTGVIAGQAETLEDRPLIGSGAGSHIRAEAL
jgi:ArsR family transcriptional regulator